MMTSTAQYPTHLPDNGDDNQGSPSAEQPSQPGPHKRVYQACIPCRRRKVKCDLGSVDNPRDPPCVRCRRESKECFFSATRRKRKHEDGRPDSLDGYDYADDYIVRNGRKMVSGSPPASIHSSSMAAPAPARPAVPYTDNAPPPPPPLTPGGSIGQPVPLRRPHGSREISNRDPKPGDGPNTRLENLEAQELMRREVYGPHDALDLLYKAATDSPGHKRGGSIQMSPVVGANSSTQLPSPGQSGGRQYQQTFMRPPEIPRDAPIDPALSSGSPGRPDRMQDQGYKEAIKAWSRFRFVRAGWFTPAEAIDYIEYYYEYLSPLTPISPPTFRDPATHITLLTEEPILSVTLLTIASRYRRMPGPGGHCRSHAIHEQLWTYLRGMIERCLWGQEAFGGGFCGPGLGEEAQSSSTAPWRGLRKGSLRTLGTIESLMILTEWHPRALHFPPAEATDELMLPNYDTPDTYSTDDEAHRLPGGVGGKRIESWLEPAWRSDRMCWMLLSTAMGLAYELGVFDNIQELLDEGGEMTRPEYEDEAYRLRAGRIKRLLLIYVTQLAGRLGWTNMVPENLRVTDIVFAPRKRRSSFADGKTPDTNTTVSNSFNYIPDLELDDQIIHCWAGISNAMRIGNERLFKSRQYTTRIIQDQSYIELLKDFKPMLDTWQKEFQRFHRLPQYIRHILTIEYEYVRIYVNSLSLQAVVERCTSFPGHHPHGDTNGNTDTGNALSPETQNHYGKLPLFKVGGFGPADQEYVKEVVDGSRNLLRTVVDGLLPGGYLKHAPVRTYFRIISGAMFLLKTFALGASKNDVEISIKLMDSAVHALRNCVVDDVHLGSRFADLLETLTSRLRSRFISAPTGPPPPSGTSSSRHRSPLHRPEPDLKRVKTDQRDHIREWNAATPNFQMGNNSADFNNSNITATPFDHGQGPYFPNPATPYNHAAGSSHYEDMQDIFGPVGDWNGQNEIWYLPPGPAFYQNSDQTTTQTAEGVNVGGMDLLDFMVGEPFVGVDGPATF